MDFRFFGILSKIAFFFQVLPSSGGILRLHLEIRPPAHYNNTY